MRAAAWFVLCPAALLPGDALRSELITCGVLFSISLASILF
jgi:hypothetical protein